MTPGATSPQATVSRISGARAGFAGLKNGDEMALWGETVVVWSLVRTRNMHVLRVMSYCMPMHHVGQFAGKTKHVSR